LQFKKNLSQLILPVSEPSTTKLRGVNDLHICRWASNNRKQGKCSPLICVLCTVKWTMWMIILYQLIPQSQKFDTIGRR
jgi:hypothetical protein